MGLQEVLEDKTAPEGIASFQPGKVTAQKTRVKLWDLPIRIFHWSLVAAVTTAIVTAKIGGDVMPWHGRAGLTIVGLVAFRLSWGFFGSTHARFTSFVPTPAKILAYLKGQWHGLGHNPLGALSVLALLLVLGVQAGTGLFSNDDISFTGPLIDLVDEELSHRLTSWHHQLINVIYALLGLHIAAILFYVKVKKDNLVKPMITGWKDVDAKESAANKDAKQAGPVAFFVSVLIAAAAVYAANGAWIQRTKAPASAATATPAATSGSNAAPAW